MFYFLGLTICRHPQYAEVISRLQSGQKFVDLGCCFGQDVRRLALDGAPQQNMCGMDLRHEFIDLGYDLFLDRATLQSEMVGGVDVFDEGNGALKKVEGQIDVVYTSSFFHLFDWDQQVTVAKRVVKMLKPQPGSMLFGRHTANLVAKHYPSRHLPESNPYRHNEESWGNLWKQVGEETGTSWKVDAELYELRSDLRKERIRIDPNFRMMRFSAMRL
jgi:hypothetical protein